VTAATRDKPIILAVDDEPQILRALAALLGTRFEVLSDSDGRAAIETLKAREVAVILSDQRMPGMTGDQFLAQARTVSDATRILLTGYADLEATVRAVNDGKIYGFVAKPWDPDRLSDTVQKAADHYDLKRELEHERRLLANLMNSTPDAIYFRDRDLDFIRVNKAYANLLGLDDAPAEPRGIADFLVRVARQTAELHANDDDVLASREPAADWTACVRLISQDERWHSVSKAPILDASGAAVGLVGISRDITERRRVADELRRSNTELERFAYVASHDLQEPLRTITSYLQLLERRYRGKLDQQADEYIRFVIDGAQRMRLLMQGLLEYSRLGRSDRPLTQVDMNRVVDDAMAALRQQITENGARITRDDLAPVQGDRLQLIQLFQNLISNSIKFRGKDAPRVHVSCVASPKGHQFEVADNGIGIEPQFREHIFEMFNRLHDRERYPGHGIGLALCRRIVDRHAGRIWVEGKPGAGTRFCFTICRPGERDPKPAP